MKQNPVVVAVADAAATVISKQRFFKTYANTIVGGIAALAGALTGLAGVWATTGEFSAPAAVVSVIATFFTVLSLRLTPNGLTPENAAELEEAARANVEVEAVVPLVEPLVERAALSLPELLKRAGLSG